MRRLKIPADVAALIRGLHPDLKRKIRSALDDLLGDPTIGKPLREELMLRLRAEAVVGPTALKDDIERRLAIHREQLALYLKLEAHDFPPPVASREAQLQHLVLTAGIMFEASWIEWSEKALQVLTQPQENQKRP